MSGKQAKWIRYERKRRYEWDHYQWECREPPVFFFISHWLWKREEPKWEDYRRLKV